MDRKLVIILGAAAGVMSLTAWLCYPAAPPPIPAADRHFMHCRECNTETPYLAERFEKPCPKCAAEGKMVATKNSLNTTGPAPTLYSRLFPPLMIEANLLMAGLLGYAIWSRKKRSEEEYLYTECPKCTQRLRYRVEKIGAAGQCPRCKRSLVFPEREADEVELPLWSPARWRRDAGKLWGRLREKARGRFARKIASQPEDQEP